MDPKSIDDQTPLMGASLAPGKKLADQTGFVVERWAWCHVYLLPFLLEFLPTVDEAAQRRVQRKNITSSDCPLYILAGKQYPTEFWLQ